MIKYFFLIMSLSGAADLDPRLLAPFETKKVIPYMHEKLHEFKLLEEAIRREIKLVNTAKTSNKAELAYDNLEEYLMRLVIAREWGEKLFTSNIHASAPTELLAVCGYTQKDIADQNTFKGVSFPGDVIRLLYKKEIYVITIASLARDAEMCRAFVNHTFFLLYQRVVGACAVLKGELDCSDLGAKINCTDESLISSIAQAHYDGEIIGEVHRQKLATFMRENIPYGISFERPESVEMVILPFSDHILALDRVYTEWAGLMRLCYPYNKLRLGKKRHEENEVAAVKMVIAQLDPDLKTKITRKELVYFFLIEEISNRYFKKYSERLTVLASQIKKTKGNLSPLALTTRLQLKCAESEASRLEKESLEWGKKVQEASDSLNRQKETLTALMEKRGQLNDRILSLNAEFDLLKKQGLTEASEFKKLVDGYNKQKEAISCLQKQLSDLQREHSKAVKERDYLQARTVCSRDDVDQVIRECDSIRPQIEQLNARVQEFMNPAFLVALEKENQRLKEEQLEKQKKLEALRARLAVRQGDRQ